MKKNSLMADSILVQSQIMKALGNKEIRVFDIGAHRGQTAKVYRSHFPSSEIYCFEPYPDSIAEIKEQFSNDPKTHIVPMAVAQQKGSLSFYVNDLNVTNSLLPLTSDIKRYYSQKNRQKKVIDVNGIDIDTFIQEEQLASVDILKLDIQGGELSALQGANALLESGDTPIIYTEVSFFSQYDGAPLFYDIWTFLIQYGYSLLNIYNMTVATKGQLLQGDALFVNRHVRSEVINNLS